VANCAKAATARRCTTASVRATSALTTPDQGIAAKVVVVEPTGAGNRLLLEVGGEQLIVVLHEPHRSAARRTHRPGDRAAPRTHLFDEGSSQRID